MPSHKFLIKLPPLLDEYAQSSSFPFHTFESIDPSSHPKSVCSSFHHGPLMMILFFLAAAEAAFLGPSPSLYYADNEAVCVVMRKGRRERPQHIMCQCTHV